MFAITCALLNMVPPGTRGLAVTLEAGPRSRLPSTANVDPPGVT